MRIMLTFATKNQNPNWRINKHAVQGLIYRFFKKTNFSHLHDVKTPKHFSFSDIYPSERNDLSLISFTIASPIDTLIQEIYEIIKREKYELEFRDYKLKDVKIQKKSFVRHLRTGSPVVLVEDSDKNTYYSFKRKTMDLIKFDELIKMSAIKRYQKFTDDKEFNFEGSIFEELEFRKEVAVRVDISGRKFIVIGSTWHKLVLSKKIDPAFCTWLIDAGIGQKTPLGFGFLKIYAIGRKNTNYKEIVGKINT